MAGILSHPACPLHSDTLESKPTMRQKPSLTSVDAVKMVAAAKIEAARNNWNVTIAVVDDGGYLVHLDRMDGTRHHTPEFATLKARTAAIFRAPTKVLEDATKERPGRGSLPAYCRYRAGSPLCSKASAWVVSAFPASNRMRMNRSPKPAW